MKVKHILFGFVVTLIFSMNFMLSISTVYADVQVGRYSYKYFTYDITSNDTIILITCDKSVEEVTVPDTIYGLPVTDINSTTFIGCNNLKKINVSKSNKYFSIDENGILMNKDQTRAIKCPPKLGIEVYFMPPMINSVAPYCFENCSSLEFLSLPNNIETIGDSAFKGASFSNVTIPDKVISVGEKSFGYDRNGKMDGFTIYGMSDSAARKYADKNDISFVPTDNSDYKVSINGNLYYCSDDENFSGAGIVVTDKNGKAVSYGFASTPKEVFHSYGNKVTPVNIYDSSFSLITPVNVRVTVAGDANMDGVLNIRDAAYIASMLAKRREFYGFAKKSADKNKDGRADIRDSSQIAKSLAVHN